MNPQAAQEHIHHRLRTELDPAYAYHSLAHTEDVVAATREIAELEGVSKHETDLLVTAAWYHDCGFIIGSQDHEISGCEIVRTTLPTFDFTESDIEAICGMIMATKIPQSPTNRLEEILADADLDYLGRNDFGEIGDRLFTELSNYHILSDRLTWDRIQISFLQKHTYFTETNIERRRPRKLQHLHELEHRVALAE